MTADAALLELLRLLKQADYQFTAVTPATHERVLVRERDASGLRDIFGWNRRFAEADIDARMHQCLIDSDMVERDGDKLRSKLRVASLGSDLFLHSAFPTTSHDAVFFGPDTYRFARLLRERMPFLTTAPASIVDMGTGCGAGAITAARLFADARITAVDINPAALRLAAINAAAAEMRIETLCAAEVLERTDLVIANPPYIMDANGRAYRDGGELLGGQVALNWTKQALGALSSGGTMLLYTGASVSKGEVPLVTALQETCASTSAEIEIEEEDPDVFGEELEQPAYADVERIAVIWATIRKR